VNGAASPGSLLDEILPRYDFHEVHDTLVPVQPERAYAAVKGVSAREIRLLGPLMSVRRLPATLTRRRAVGFEGPGTVLEAAFRAGFVLLDERPGEELVAGAVGRFWSLTGNQPLRAVRTREDFVAFAQPGYAKVAINFLVTAVEQGSRIETATRIAGTDSRATAKFGIYWAVIRLPSGAIRRSWLRAIGQRAGREDAPAI
jgi:hypothetical protein